MAMGFTWIGMILDRFSSRLWIMICNVHRQLYQSNIDRNITVLLDLMGQHRPSNIRALGLEVSNVPHTGECPSIAVCWLVSLICDAVTAAVPYQLLERSCSFKGSHGLLQTTRRRSAILRIENSTIFGLGDDHIMRRVTRVLDDPRAMHTVYHNGSWLHGATQAMYSRNGFSMVKLSRLCTPASV